MFELFICMVEMYFLKVHFDDQRMLVVEMVYLLHEVEVVSWRMETGIPLSDRQ